VKQRVFVYSRTEPPSACNISKVCVRVGLHDDATEEILQEIENRAAPVLHRLIREPLSPLMVINAKDREILSPFIGYMSSRNPYTLDELEKIHDVHCDILTALASTNPDLLEDYLRDSGLNIGRDAVLEISQSLPAEELKGLVAKAVHGEWLPKLIEYGDKTAGLLIERNSWVVARTQPGRFLITSDSPVVPADLEREPGVETIQDNGLVHFPISPEKTILISDGNPRVNPGGLTNRQARNLNSLEMHYAYRSVYSDKNEAFIDDHFKRTGEGALLDIARETSRIYEIQKHYSEYLQ
jgi:hypothetical protein